MSAPSRVAPRSNLATGKRHLRRVSRVGMVAASGLTSFAGPCSGYTDAPVRGTSAGGRGSAPGLCPKRGVTPKTRATRDLVVVDILGQTGGHHGTSAEGDARDRDGGGTDRDRERLRALVLLPGRRGVHADPRGGRRRARAVLHAGPQLGPVRRVPLRHGHGTPRLGGSGGRGDRARADPPAGEAGEGRLPPRQPGRAGGIRVRLRGRLDRLRGDGRPAGPLRHRRLRSARRRTVDRGVVLRPGRARQAALRRPAALPGQQRVDHRPERAHPRVRPGMPRGRAHCWRTSTR